MAWHVGPADNQDKEIFDAASRSSFVAWRLFHKRGDASNTDACVLKHDP